VAPQIKDFDSWHAVGSVLPKQQRKNNDGSMPPLITIRRVYLPAGDVRNGLYDDFARNYALGMKGVVVYERHDIPYPGGHLPGFRLPAKAKELQRSFFTAAMIRSSKSFYPFLEPLTNYGWTVLGFDGPGQGWRASPGNLFYSRVGEIRQSCARLL